MQPAAGEEPSIVPDFLYEPGTFVKEHTLAVERESSSEEKQIMEFNNPAFPKKPWTYKAYVITKPTSKGIILLVHLNENHEIFPAVGEICQIQLESRPSEKNKKKEYSSPRLAERVESFQSLPARWRKFAEFHVAPAPSDHWIDESAGKKDEGKTFNEWRPPLQSLLD